MVAAASEVRSVEVGGNNFLIRYQSYLPPQYSMLFGRFYTEIRTLDAFAHHLVAQQSVDCARKIQTFALHLFSRGSVLPVSNEIDSIDRCPLDFLEQEDNKPKYYRGDGSSAVRILLENIRERFPSIDLTDETRAGLVKPFCFTENMKKACGFCHCAFSSVSTITSIPAATSLSFVDITDWITRKAKGSEWTADSIEQACGEVEEQLAELQERPTLLGGVFEIHPHLGVYVFFSPEGERHKEEFEGLINTMLDCRGNTGSFPELVMVKRALVDFYNQPQEGEAVPLVVEPRDRQEIEVKGPFASYQRLINRLIQAVACDEERVEIHYAKKSIHKSIAKLEQEELTFQEQLNEYYFLIEQILFLSLFKNFTQELEEVFLTTHPLCERGEVLCYNSGMSCLDYIIGAVRKEYPEDENPSLAIFDGCYYELKDQLRWFFQNRWKTSEISQTDSFEEIDLLIFDLYPNNVLLNEARENQIIAKVSALLDSLPYQERLVPLTLVVDASTALLTDPKFAEIKASLWPYIDSGRLRLIFMSSLAKFYSCGFDKYTGGVLVHFGHDKKCVGELKACRDADPMSDETKFFFSLIVGSALPEVQLYYETTLRNTNILYEQLQARFLGGENYIQVQPKDERIPVIGLRSAPQDAEVDEDMQREFTKSLEEQVIRLAQERHLPLFNRASFPFAHSALVECDQALRVVAGLDVQENGENYMKIFSQVVPSVQAD